MKQIRVRVFMSGDIGWGVEEGKEVHRRLEREISAVPACVVGLDLSGVTKADVSFARESIVETIRRFRPAFQFVLLNPENEVIVENLEAALDRRGDSALLRERGGTVRVVGHQLGPSVQPVFETIKKLGEATSREVMTHYRDSSIQNVSNKLKDLWATGLLARDEVAAKSGGREWRYRFPG